MAFAWARVQNTYKVGGGRLADKTTPVPDIHHASETPDTGVSYLTRQELQPLFWDMLLGLK